MSKKSTKRQVRQTSSGAKAETRTGAPTSGISSRLSDRFEFNPDYTPVIKDLKRIGTLAGTFFLILIVLSFFLR